MKHLFRFSLAALCLTVSTFKTLAADKVQVLYAGKKLEWDTKKMCAPNAERFIRRDYRKGWKLS